MYLRELFRNPQPLFVCRSLLNIDAIKQWAADAGFDSTLADLHVTVAYSKKAVDWREFSPQHNRLTVHGGKRRVKLLGDKEAIVLSFPSKYLSKRWQEFCDGGASREHEEYQAHITISYQGEKIDLDSIKPYDGDLVFGPEKFSVIEDDWFDKLDEVDIAR